LLNIDFIDIKLFDQLIGILAPSLALVVIPIYKRHSQDSDDAHHPKNSVVDLDMKTFE
jgi:hypothetical protein